MESLPPNSGQRDIYDRASLIRTVLEAVPGGVVHVAVDGSIVEANAEALRILGFRFDQIQRRYISDWDPVTIHEDGRPCPVEEYPVALVLTTGKPQGPTTIGIQRPDGVISWAVFRAAPTHTANGTLSGAIVTFLDITDRKRTEEQLVRSEEKWRSLATHMPDFVLIGGRDGAIQSINRVLPGYEMEKVVGSRGWEYIAEPLRDEWRQRYLEAVESGKVCRFDTRAVDDDGGPVWYETILVPLLEDGKTARVVWVARDITERRTMMSKLAEKERLASVGMVAASVAHEIMNPLTYVLANLDFAKSDKCESEERRMRAIMDAREGAARMQQIVWDLRSLGRTGTEELFYVDVRSVIETSLRLASPEIGGRNAKLTVDLPEVPGVLASESRLCQVFINLLVNAAQAMESKPPEERLLCVTTHTNADESMVAVEVSDTGLGISPEQLGRIFDPFFTTKRSGTGLGLSISRDCIERMGGRIDVTSEPGRGTTFTVWLSTQRLPRSSG
ncbi:MAG: PAS domain S-box protein [Labilithrix sp.]